MGRSKKLKNLIFICTDKAKIIKATLSINHHHHHTTTIQIAVLRATTRAALSQPPDHRIAALLSLGHATRHSAYACVHATLHRLHRHHGSSVYVALKCLIALHNMAARGSFVLKEQLALYPEPDSLGFLDLSRFVDGTDAETREFSTWVRWYAGFLQQNLSACRVLRCFLSSTSKFELEKNKETLRLSLMMDLFEEIKVLFSTIEEICRAPSSLHCQTNDIVYEVMRLVGEDYRITQYHTMIRLSELRVRSRGLSDGELGEWTQRLQRLEGWKGRLTELFANRKRHDAFWDSVGETTAELGRVKDGREMESVSRKVIVDVSESTRRQKQLVEASQRLRLLPLGEVNHWLTV